jgi:DNA-binding SARP family transcriptional activator
MELRILGPLEALADGRRIRLRGARQRALTAWLAVRANEAVSSHRLLDELWGSEPHSGPAALRVRISQLRRTLGPWGERMP